MCTKKGIGLEMELLVAEDPAALNPAWKMQVMFHTSRDKLLHFLGKSKRCVALPVPDEEAEYQSRCIKSCQEALIIGSWWSSGKSSPRNGE